jgi:hypothetical protein
MRRTVAEGNQRKAFIGIRTAPRKQKREKTKSTGPT